VLSLGARPTSGFAAILAVAALTTCAPAEDDSQESADAEVVQFTARDYAFRGLPDTLPSGWTTFRMENAGQEVHFVVFDRLPDGRTAEGFVREVAAPFDSVWYRLRDGEIDKQEALAQLGEQLPEWYGSVRRWGGTGLVAPGGTAQTTIDLEPGTYVLECYVKSPAGEFHVSVGMWHELTVTGDSTGRAAPEAEFEMTVSGDGIEAPDTVAAGRHTFEARFGERPAGSLGGDANLVRVDGDVSLEEEVVPWMDWTNVDGLGAPAPAEFLGGTQEMRAGRTSYFTVDLEPGSYAWISEPPVRMKRFTVR
jgi:hypothetical protein